MSRVVRLGAVNYLNVRPLVYGLEARRDVSLRFDVPSRCAQLLQDREIDLGMVPSITYLNRPGDRVVPGMCIGSDGPVASVALFASRPMREVRTIAMDTSSRTSAALVRILCRRVFNITPTFVPHAPDLPTMLASADAALLIGDPALFVDPRVYDASKVDLGEQWTTMTGLPFVWAFWSGPADAADVSTVAVLQAAAREGTERFREVADAYCRAVPERIPVAEAYLRDNLIFSFGARERQGLETFYREAVSAGVVSSMVSPAFFESPA